MSIVASQFLHDQTWGATPDKFSTPNGYSDYLASLCRVSRLKFDLAFDIEEPESPASSAKLMSMIEDNRLYYLILMGLSLEAFENTSTLSQIGHAVTLATSSSGPSKFFDVNRGEFEIDVNRLATFFFDYWEAEREGGALYNKVLWYEVTNVAEGWPYRLVVDGLRPPVPRHSRRPGCVVS